MLSVQWGRFIEKLGCSVSAPFHHIRSSINSGQIITMNQRITSLLVSFFVVLRSEMQFMFQLICWPLKRIPCMVEQVHRKPSACLEQHTRWSLTRFERSLPCIRTAHRSVYSSYPSRILPVIWFIILYSLGATGRVPVQYRKINHAPYLTISLLIIASRKLSIGQIDQNLRIFDRNGPVESQYEWWIMIADFLKVLFPRNFEQTLNKI